MYLPAHFREERVSVLQEAMAGIGVATLVTHAEGALEANHYPLLVKPDPAPLGTLWGHMARANPQWKRPGSEALAIFLGPNAYVTPSWYPTKQETGKVVPTWNYLSVQAYGELEMFDDPGELRELVGALTSRHEAPRAAPWAVGDAPTDYIDSMLRAIVGFRLVITRLEGKWKMSQNRVPQDKTGVQAGMAAEGGFAEKAVADIMAQSGTR